MSQSQKNTSANAVFLDANVLLEIILGRNKEAAARKFIERNSENLYISALTAHLVVHFGKSIVALPVLRKFLADYTILSLDDADFEWAFTNIRGGDFEDALQIAVAVRNGCNELITFDKKLVSTYQELPSIQSKLLS
ncbi:MAG TPA: PIN domain-containing protein [Candidatus Limnocylindria bacterium]|nr:PIN domain-containing protein [Candidatus Limnocylindria bacterium]